MITALGATMLVGPGGLRRPVRFTADDYYDAQRLFDISVKSTLGLDEADISALSEVDGVEVAEGGYTESALHPGRRLEREGRSQSLSAAGLNEPRVIEGRLPRDVCMRWPSRRSTGCEWQEDRRHRDLRERRGEARRHGRRGLRCRRINWDATAISSAAVDTITASVFDPMDVNAGSKTMSFRSTGGPQYAFFLTPAAVVDSRYAYRRLPSCCRRPEPCPTRMNTRSSSMVSRDASSRFASVARRSARAM